MVEHKMYCTLAAELSKDWSKLIKCFNLFVCNFADDSKGLE